MAKHIIKKKIVQVATNTGGTVFAVTDDGSLYMSSNWRNNGEWIECKDIEEIIEKK